MTVSTLDLAPALNHPYYVTHPGPWAGHIPFAHWLVAIHKPLVIVELGTFRGNSYFNFCHAVKACNLPARTYAIDTWKGDGHGGFYDESIYQEVQSYNETHFSAFSTLIRSTFDEAIETFQNGSIDLLHIDGYHTYEAVKRDFENWLPKLSDRGLLLLHDTDVFDRGFGVWRLYEELKSQFPSFRFTHSHGLGVVMIGPHVSETLLQLDARKPDNQEWIAVHQAFSRLGHFYYNEAELGHYTSALAISDRKVRELEDVKTTLMLTGEQSSEMLKQAIAITQRLRSQANLLSRICRYNESEMRRLGNENARLSREGQCSADSLEAVRQSSSWKVTAPLRAVTTYFRRIKKLFKLVIKGQFQEIFKLIALRMKNARGQSLQLENDSQFASDVYEADGSISIIASPHTLYIAYCLARALSLAGFAISVLTEMPQKFSSRYYFVVCAQMFNRLPPSDKRICVQLEQSCSPRWFTPNYIKVLRESLAVIEYSSSGLRFLDGFNISYPKVFYAKVGGLSNYPSYLTKYGIQVSSYSKEYDVIFYGDTNCIRRKFLLDAITARYNVKIVNDLFGADLYREIVKARVCLNLHYYDGASLESTRIFESLSLGVPIVSETADDVSDYDFALYDGSIAFAEVGNAEQIISLIGEMIENEKSVPPIANQRSEAEFNFYINRFMMSLGAITFSRVYTQSRHIRLDSKIIALSMPETHERRDLLLSNISPSTSLFPGLRASPGWVGAGCSYKYLAKKLLESGVDHALIYEDDAEFVGGLNPEEILSFATRLKKRCDWQVFSTLISDLHDHADISEIFTFENRECVLMDRMIGMVCNVYSRAALELLAQWDECNSDVETNTIDRYLESFDHLKIVTTAPFLTQQSDRVASSMWATRNIQMRDMITASSHLMNEKIWSYKVAQKLSHVANKDTLPRKLVAVSADGSKNRTFRLR